MDHYKEAVERLAQASEGFTFSNKGAEHAAIVLTSLFKHAQDRIKMFSGTLNEDVACNKEFLKELNKFMDSGKELKVTLEEIPNNKSDALKQIIESSKNPKRNVKYTIAPKEFIEKIKEAFDGEIVHFAVADGKAYRLEIDPKEYKAICDFNDVEIAQKLEKLFDKYFQKS